MFWANFKINTNPLHSSKHLYIETSHNTFITNKINIYINKDRNPSTKGTRYVKANVNTQQENQDNQNISNEVENEMLKGLPLPQIN
jgi:hypothetical protein